MLKVLHVTYYDQYSGSGRAAFRLHSALKNSGAAQSSMLVMQKTSDDPSVTEFPAAAYRRAVISQRLSARLISLIHDGNPCAHSLNLFDNPAALDAINGSDADLIHLHWPGGEMLSIRQIPRIRKPVIWTLHDTWAFCGAEHYINPLDPGDTRYKTGYNGSCFDLNSVTWRRKMRHGWSDLPFRFTAPGQWLADRFSDSKLFAGKACSYIPNMIDTNIFCKMDKAAARASLGLPADKKILLTGAQSNAAPVKGMHLLWESLQFFADQKDRFLLCSFGSGKMGDSIPLPHRSFGTVTDEKQMALLYAAADVLIQPSLIENASCIIQESLACGTPVAAFRTGGTPGMTGLDTLAECYDTQELADKIMWAAFHPDQIRIPEQKPDPLKDYLALYEETVQYGGTHHG